MKNILEAQPAVDAYYVELSGQASERSSLLCSLCKHTPTGNIKGEKTWIKVPFLLNQNRFCACQEDGGVYSCIADNGVGSPAEALVNLQVLCKYSCPRENLSISSSPKNKFIRKWFLPDKNISTTLEEENWEWLPSVLCGTKMDSFHFSQSIFDEQFKV